MKKIAKEITFAKTKSIRTLRDNRPRILSELKNRPTPKKILLSAKMCAVNMGICTPKKLDTLKKKNTAKKRFDEAKLKANAGGIFPKKIMKLMIVMRIRKPAAMTLIVS